MSAAMARPSTAVRRRTASSGDAGASAERLRPPSAWHVLLEGRAPWELAAMLATRPWWGRLPRGDGRPVIAFPGLATGDVSTLPLRRFLTAIGYTAYPWHQGFNVGPRSGVLESCLALLERVADRHRVPVSLVGWSLGGIYAREIAKLRPERVRCVVTLGTPFTGDPRATHATRLYELLSRTRIDDDAALLAELKRPPPVPTTSIYSRSDGIVAWPCSLNGEQPLAEDIEVRASHFGMGMNPVALHALADRLAEDPADWHRFARQGLRRWFYPSTGAPTQRPGP